MTSDRTNEHTARAFSGHRFEEAFDRIAPDATWTLVGDARIEGRDAIIDACRGTAKENANVQTTWLRFVSAGTDDVVAVDAVGRYTGTDGVATVSSCDIFEFKSELIAAITSYAVELPDAAADALVAGHVMGDPTPEPTLEPALLDILGGVEAIHRLEELFYDKVLTDLVLREVFTARRPAHVDHLTAFTAESFGGEDRFTRELGFAYLIDVHRSLQITEEQRQRFIDLYRDAFNEVALTDDPQVHDAVIAHVEFGSHVAMQNSHATTDSELHPLREVPHWTVDRP